jgi:hypothetical protein
MQRLRRSAQSLKAATDIDADKWRIGQMKEFRDAVGSENVAFLISEACKPSNDRQKWAGVWPRQAYQIVGDASEAALLIAVEGLPRS